MATFAPAFTPRRSPGRHPAALPQAGVARQAVIVGAGLAGACAAASLAQLGWRCTVLDRHAAPAHEASGNPAGIFHGTAHGDDGVHARFTRAAALLAARRYAPLLADGRVAGHIDGLVRMRPGSAMPGLPADYLRAVDDAELQALAGHALAGPAWFYPGGGWLAPAELVRAWLGTPGVDLRGGVQVDRLERRDDCWHAIGAGGATLAAAPVLVLAAGAGMPALLPASDAVHWPLRSVRGQVTWIDASARLARPVSGHGYALSLPDGRLLCGATTADADADANLRDADHACNLARLRELAGIEPAAGALPGGRVGWRSVALDRLPLVGAVPLPRAALQPGTRLDQARLVPRVPGLFVLGGLASRGLTWGPLAGDVLAAWIDGAPLPLEADLLDAIDPARWIVRAARASAG